MRLTDEQMAARKRRNLAIALGLVAFMVLIFVTTVLNLRRNIEAAADQRAAEQAEFTAPVASGVQR
ncbi:hypothetical protein [Brevundimonas lutea]|uniref:hypothetical protein n=1 Tax=Brevundimonas lutea TaxID=2293980 RepID=UPI000F01EE48|nr:hypothetical protein [Brevundimonas lutea]